MHRVVAAKRDRILTVIGRREQWRDELNLVRRLHTNVLEAEAILSGARLETQCQAVTNAAVQAQYATWCATLLLRLEHSALGETERKCLKHFLKVTTSLSSRLFHCYDVSNIPRTNNDLEGFIRSVKTRYRRISGRKNWNRYLIRYGARIAFYEGRARTNELAVLDYELHRVTATRWKEERYEQGIREQEQIKQYRVRHRRAAFLADLEARWAELMACT